jgi:RNA polymerase sigma factor (sigma-70 family)
LPDVTDTHAVRTEDPTVSTRDALQPGHPLALASWEFTNKRTEASSARWSSQASSPQGGGSAHPIGGATVPKVMQSDTNSTACAGGENREHGCNRLPRHRGHDVTNLVRAAASGDQHAWSALIRRYSATIRAVARRNGLSKADQDDVAQRTWLRLFQHIEHVRQPAALGAWLATVARRECLRTLAASQREVLVDEPVSADQDDLTALETVVRSERRAALHAAVDSLPGHERELMRTLLAKPAFSYDELSAALGIPRGSIGPTRGRSLARLRRDPHLARAIGRSAGAGLRQTRSGDCV